MLIQSTNWSRSKPVISFDHISLEKRHEKKMWSLVSRGPLQSTQSELVERFHDAIMSAVQSLSSVAHQVKKEYFGVEWVNHIASDQLTCWAVRRILFHIIFLNWTNFCKAYPCVSIVIRPLFLGWEMISECQSLLHFFEETSPRQSVFCIGHLFFSWKHDELELCANLLVFISERSCQCDQRLCILISDLSFLWDSLHPR